MPRAQALRKVRGRVLALPGRLFFAPAPEKALCAGGQRQGEGLGAMSADIGTLWGRDGERRGKRAGGSSRGLVHYLQPQQKSDLFFNGFGFIARSRHPLF